MAAFRAARRVALIRASVAIVTGLSCAAPTPLARTSSPRLAPPQPRIRRKFLDGAFPGLASGFICWHRMTKPTADTLAAPAPRAFSGGEALLPLRLTAPALADLPNGPGSTLGACARLCCWSPISAAATS